MGGEDHAVTGGSLQVLLVYSCCSTFPLESSRFATPPRPHLCMCVCCVVSVTALVTGQLIRACEEAFGGMAMKGS